MPTFPPRRAKPRQSFGYTTAEGEQRELRANADGLVRPQSAQDVRILDNYGLPEARVTTRRSRSRSEEPADEPKGPDQPDGEEG